MSRKPGVRERLRTCFIRHKVSNCPSIISVRAYDTLSLPRGPHKQQLAYQLHTLRALKNKTKNLLLPKTHANIYLFLCPSSGKRGGEN